MVAPIAITFLTEGFNSSFQLTLPSFPIILLILSISFKPASIDPKTLLNMLCAFNSHPLERSHRGLSGINKMIIQYIKDGKADMPSMLLHTSRLNSLCTNGFENSEEAEPANRSKA